MCNVLTMDYWPGIIYWRLVTKRVKNFIYGLKIQKPCIAFVQLVAALNSEEYEVFFNISFCFACNAQYVLTSKLHF